MDAASVIAAAVLGLAGGVAGGLLGVGGGVIFVPALALLLEQGQVEAEATSLLAIIGVGLVGAWRQHGYGNLRIRDGLTLGVLAAAGAAGGVAIANAVPERALEYAFAVVMLFFAYRLGRRALGRV